MQYNYTILISPIFLRKQLKRTCVSKLTNNSELNLQIKKSFLHSFNSESATIGPSSPEAHGNVYALTSRKKSKIYDVKNTQKPEEKKKISVLYNKKSGEQTDKQLKNIFIICQLSNYKLACIYHSAN